MTQLPAHIILPKPLRSCEKGSGFSFPDFLLLCFGRLAAILEAEVRSFFAEFDSLLVHVVGLSVHFFNLARLATMWTNLGLGLFVIGHATSSSSCSELKRIMSEKLAEAAACGCRSAAESKSAPSVLFVDAPGAPSK